MAILVTPAAPHTNLEAYMPGYESIGIVHRLRVIESDSMHPFSRSHSSQPARRYGRAGKRGRNCGPGHVQIPQAYRPETQDGAIHIRADLAVPESIVASAWCC